MYRRRAYYQREVKNLQGFVNRLFSYIKCCLHSDIVEGQHCNDSDDSDNKEGQVGKELPLDGSYSHRSESTFRIV
jgi:hypothetical protein